jgi:zinc/manganese transport system permease protein
MLAEMIAQPFMRHALIAGTVIALACGFTGYFIVLRGQLFAGDALSHVAFTGTLAALLVGLDPRVGLFAGTVLVALILAVLGSKAGADDVAIGSVFAFVLGLGVLFLSLFTSSMSSTRSSIGSATLFGSILGLDAEAVVLICVVGGAAIAALVTIARPLLFATLDEGVAGARGVPTRAVGTAFLVLVAVVAAEAAQAVGALLLLGLLAAPAAAAQAVTHRPYRAMGLSMVLAVASMWGGLLVSYAVPSAPPSFAVIAIASATYAAAGGIARLRRA